jgi:hypothetical protein
MPFDSAEFARAYPTPAPTPKERLALLIDELRKPLPNWDFRISNHCAIGLAWQLFPEVGGKSASDMGKFFGVPSNTLHELLATPAIYGHRHHDRVRQEEVRVRLEKLLDDWHQ